MTSQERSGTTRLRPRARIISVIGDELISDEPVAIVELVKNSYDADATKVEVRFEGTDPARPERILVSDDGHGMALSTVLNSWFEPGTIQKRKGDRSPRGRSLLGAKGIGRFAAARLANYLLLESKAVGSPDTIKAKLSWSDFGGEKDYEKYLDEVSVQWHLETAPKTKHGTLLILEELRKKHWEDSDFERLHARLSRLVSPFRQITDFSIVLEIPGYPQYSGEAVPPDLILQPVYELVGSVDAKGLFTGEIRHEKKIRKHIKSLKIAGKDQLPFCGPFEVEIRAWDRDRPGLDPIAKQFGMGITEIRRTLNNFCGVSIYRDDFRVHPYGELGNDWLNLDHHSRQNPTMNLANNQTIAAIKISREDNPGLIDRSTREGMVLNEQHRALEVWFKRVLSLLEEERYRIRPRRTDDERVIPLFETLDIGDAAKAVRKELGADHPTALLITEAEKQMRAGVDRVQEVFSRLLMLSGRGQMIDIVIHEIGAPLGKVFRQLVVAERDMAKDCSPPAKKVFAPQILSIKSWLEQIHALRDRLEPQTPAKRGRATTFDVCEEIEDNFHLFEALIEKQKIKWTIEAPKAPLQVKMSRASLGQILANLIDNSIYWIIDQKGLGEGGRIKVKLSRLKEGFRVVLSDDGPGVNEEDQSRIFEPYFSTKRGGSGMGLGLYICRLVIEPYGRIVYRDDITDLLGAHFEVTFERKVGL